MGHVIPLQPGSAGVAGEITIRTINLKGIRPKADTEGISSNEKIGMVTEGQDPLLEKMFMRTRTRTESAREIWKYQPLFTFYYQPLFSFCSFYCFVPDLGSFPTIYYFSFLLLALFSLFHNKGSKYF